MINSDSNSKSFLKDSQTDPLKTLRLGSAMVRLKYDISESTIQVEEYVDEMDDCTHCQGAK